MRRQGDVGLTTSQSGVQYMLQEAKLLVCDACDTYYWVSRCGTLWSVRHRAKDNAWKVELQRFRLPRCPDCNVTLEDKCSDSTGSPFY